MFFLYLKTLQLKSAHNKCWEAQKILYQKIQSFICSRQSKVSIYTILTLDLSDVTLLEEYP